MPQCQSFGCSNKRGAQTESGDRISFFAIPDPKKEPELCKKWLLAIGTDKFNPATYVYHQDRVVCETHFTKECFKEDMMATIMGTTPKRKKLKGGAVPTIFSLQDEPKGRPTRPNVRPTRKRIRAKKRKEILILLVHPSQKPKKGWKSKSAPLDQTELVPEEDIPVSAYEIMEGTATADIQASFITRKVVRVYNRFVRDAGVQTEADLTTSSCQTLADATQAAYPEHDYIGYIPGSDNIRGTDGRPIFTPPYPRVPSGTQTLSSPGVTNLCTMSVKAEPEEPPVWEERSCGVIEESQKQMPEDTDMISIKVEIDDTLLLEESGKTAAEKQETVSEATESIVKEDPSSQLNICSQQSVCGPERRLFSVNRDNTVSNGKLGARHGLSSSTRRHQLQSFYEKHYNAGTEQIRTEMDPLKCQICAKSFTSKFNRKTHEITHLGQKPYHCQLCAKSFSSRSSCRRHEKVHILKNGYQCQYCEKSFVYKGSCIEHERIHTREKLFKCQICGKCFTCKTTCVVHERIHTGDKPYKCKFCEKSFVVRQNCEQHERTHTGEKPYQCNFCEKSFACKSSCKRHETIHTKQTSFRPLSHTGEKPYQCKFCEKSFACKSSCTRHETIHTKHLFQVSLL
ncbi:Zinc finger imprinted 3 [Holothuria leucospilota]|uniref:Zinc finger imprinted 3 n=1 Tax=Holothuria leucospilota TaxID=206669 RepID=A0A9Q1CR65_HOLLE|nr:Zinc finger imprinted 3 [Holothuria leucospilota]